MPRSSLSLAVDNSRFGADAHPIEVNQPQAAVPSANDAASQPRARLAKAFASIAARLPAPPSAEQVQQALVNRFGLNLQQISSLQKTVEWAGVFMGVLGAFILASRAGTVVDLVAWSIAATSNVLLIAYGLLIGSRGILVLQGAIMATAILGIVRTSMALTQALATGIHQAVTIDAMAGAQALELLTLLERALSQGGI